MHVVCIARLLIRRRCYASKRCTCVGSVVRITFAAFHVMPACMLEYMCAACVSCVCVCASLCVIEWVRTMHVHVCARVCTYER